MNILLDDIIHSGTFNGLKTGISIHEFISIHFRTTYLFLFL